MSGSTAKSIPTKSIEVQTLETLLLDWTRQPPGTLLSYRELSGGAGFDVTVSPGSGRLSRAIRNLRRDHRLKFLRIKGEGVKLANNGETVDCAGARRRHIHRAAGEALKDLAVVNVAAMSEDEKHRFNAEASIHGALFGVTSPKAVRGIESAVRATSARLPVERTLQAFLPALEATSPAGNGKQ